VGAQWIRCFGPALGIAVAAFLLLLIPAWAQGESGLTPSFGDGWLTVSGDGFQPGEGITLTVRVAGTRHQFTTTADARGRFRLATGLAVQPGASIALEARGDRGTTQAAMTSAPGPLPSPAGPGGAPVPPVIPEAESWMLVVGGLAVVGSGHRLRQRFRQRG
jgi:hypothetical protein